MKFGVDLNNEYLSEIMLEKIKCSGHMVIDLTEEKWTNRGQEVFKKVLLANITNINFYIGIEFRSINKEYEIFYSSEEASKNCSFEIQDSLNNGIRNIICEDGNHLYLIKNMNCPGMYIKAPLSESNEENNSIIDRIVEKIVGLK